MILKNTIFLTTSVQHCFIVSPNNKVFKKWKESVILILFKVLNLTKY